MPVITFANPKGGSGKTTAALLLACELAKRDADVVIIDADPERWISRWGKEPGRPERLEIINTATEENIMDVLREAAQRAHFVIVDPEGSANQLVSFAIGDSDLVIIPMQGNAMDAKGGAKAIKAIRQTEQHIRRSIPFSVLLTRTAAAVQSRSARSVEAELEDHGIDVFETSLIERAAFRELTSYGGTLDTLDPKEVNNIDKAKANARAFAMEVIAKLRKMSPAQGKVA